ncbi:MAG: TonB-dependent receptor plug domain-containing protein, partial [Bacteroidales bacterium]
MSRLSCISTKTVLFFALATSLGARVKAQEITISLQEISITGSKKSLYSTNHQLFVVDSAVLARHPGSDLTDLLTGQTNLNITRYGGHGSLSSIRLRGTAPAHTQINWNGIPLNSPTTGMMDLGLVPGGMTGRVEVVSGAAGALFGNGTFGGAINLENRADWSNRFSMRGFTETGSWNHRVAGLSVQTGGQRVQYHLDGAAQSSPNTYPF